MDVCVCSLRQMVKLWKHFSCLFVSPVRSFIFVDECLSFLISWTHLCLSETPLWGEVWLNSAKTRLDFSSTGQHSAPPFRWIMAVIFIPAVYLEQVSTWNRWIFQTSHVLQLPPGTCYPNWSLNKLDRIGVACCGLELQVCSRSWQLIVSLFRSQAPKRIQ